jgi:hypothetical protein
LTLTLVVAVLLAVAVVVAVALPFLRDPDPGSDVLEELDEHERRRVELLERRDRALAALKEVEFDHRTGALTDEDYRSLVAPLRREVASALRELDALAAVQALGSGGEAREREEQGRERDERTSVAWDAEA